MIRIVITDKLVKQGYNKFLNSLTSIWIVDHKMARRGHYVLNLKKISCSSCGPTTL